MSEQLDRDFHSKNYKHGPGDVVVHKLTGSRCIVLRQLPIKEEDVGMSEKYYVREQGGRKASYYGIELQDSTKT